MPAFQALIGVAPRVLILGSMPSQRSLQDQQYYAHPRNAFWWIMGSICGFDESIDYPARAKALFRTGIAVWDVLHDCERPGSLDSDIRRNSEQVNDFESFFDAQPSLQAVVFNGGAAHSIFKRHFPTLLQSSRGISHNINWHRLPSTSPAHASLSREQKRSQWSDVLLPYLPAALDTSLRTEQII